MSTVELVIGTIIALLNIIIGRCVLHLTYQGYAYELLKLYQRYFPNVDFSSAQIPNITTTILHISKWSFDSVTDNYYDKIKEIAKCAAIKGRS